MVRNRAERRRPSNWQRHVFWLVLAAMAVVFCCLVRYWSGPEYAGAVPPLSSVFKKSGSDSKTATPSAAEGVAGAQTNKPQVVGLVNSEQVTREELARECLKQYGNEVLESLVNKHLIEEHCMKNNVAVAPQEIDAEIDRMARKSTLPKDQFLKLLEKERGIKPSQYANDIIWPTVALRKLAAVQLTVSAEELEKGYESQFGRMVKARLIMTRNIKTAEMVHKQAVAKPEEFGTLAKKYSEDVNSASSYGLIQPIRRFLGDAELEKVAFALQPGEVSRIVKVADQYVILKCEGFVEPVKANRAEVDPLLKEAIRDRKLRSVADRIFCDIQKDARIENVYNNPARSAELPGVAAIINDHKIMVHELAETCIERHGAEVLDGILNRRLLTQALRKRSLNIGQADIDAEIARAAVAMGKTKPSGEPDVDAWLKSVTKEHHLSIELYVQNEVWPSVALKKLVGDGAKVTETDLKKGFEANYGPRVRCRAIVLNNQRKAQEVWEKARDDLSVKNFGELAEKYSIEANSRQLKGEVPPIREHGGQPLLEKEAFSLKPGELSGVVQVGENYVILLCEGYTKPTDVKFEEVRQLIYDDLLEKKLRIVMEEQYQHLKDAAQLDNYLAGTIKAPKRPGKPGDDDLDKLLDNPLEARKPGGNAPRRR